MNNTTNNAALEQALSLHRAGRLAEAGQIYRSILESNATHADAWHLLGLVALQTQRQQQAIEAISQAIAITPSQVRYHADLGEAYRAGGQLSEARACYLRALALSPAYVPAHYNLALALEAAREFLPAERHFREVLRLEPRHADAQAGLGNVLRAQKQPNEAAQAYQAALALRPDFAAALNNFGSLLVELGRAAEGHAMLSRALQLAGPSSETYCNLAHAHRVLRNPAAALASFHEALRLRPDDLVARWQLAGLLEILGNLS
ncbi:MAG TPA: tetratricopeptide repeat protein, partial [Pirellulales bacterium]|nr:tetratricopeptide repeat protein [Pirellulales bacterium]